MKTVLLLFAGIFILFSESYSQWTQTNLHGTRVVTLAANDSFLFARTSDGIFRSSDNGNHWKEITSTLKSTTFFPMIIMGSNVITPYYSSSNNGTDWVENKLKYSPFSKIVVIDDTVLLCKDDSGVSYSYDKGFNWQKADWGIPNQWQIFSPVKSGSTLYAGGEGEVFVSTNKGNSWGKLGNTQSWDKATVYDIYTKDTIVFADVSNKGLFYKTPSDSLWRRTSSEILNIEGFAQKDSVLFVGVNGNEILYRSTNNGKEWHPVHIGNTVNKFTSIVSMITKGNTIFVAMADGWMYYSSDEGNTWAESKNIGLHSEILVAHLVTCREILFAAMSFTGVSTSSDNGLSWTPTNITQNPIELFSNGTSVFVLMRSLNSFSRSGPQIYDSLIRTTDCGATWTRLNYSFNDSLKYHFAQCNSVLYAYSDAEVYKSTDNGDSWEKEKNVDFNRIIQVTTEGSTIYFLTDKYIIFSDDRGKTWASINHRQKQYTFVPNSIAVKDKKIFLGTSNQGLQFIENPLDINNQKIVKIYDGIKSRPFYKFIVNGSSIFAHTYDQIYKSTDDGKSWYVVDSMIHGYQINRFVINGSIMYAAIAAKGVWKNEKVLDVSSSENPESIQDSHILCYPNPTGNSLTIDPTGMSFNNAHSVRYILSNSIGEKVMEFEQNVQKCTVEFGELPNGVYSLTATQGVRRSTVMVSVFR